MCPPKKLLVPDPLLVCTTLKIDQLVVYIYNKCHVICYHDMRYVPENRSLGSFFQGACRENT